MDENPVLSLNEIAVIKHEYYIGLLKAGFNRQQALYLTALWGIDIYIAHPPPGSDGEQNDV